ncbi:DUF1292 domain-containing protein [Schnuerera sp. xch1]|uniref:DUF1292 domain-containing protein n=1 Tax=Schnuerera sp. xch1 TaxID=2874283 RepID=UPI001CC14DF0|nr:DUF1292 domain-containing protein [Schnuerera sp. xch1]MBZ2174477.1 DUF1292 domain-containing protein [Schnuerera sp. xch1]
MNNSHHHDHEHINLVLEDGGEMECHVLGTFEVEDNEYIALVPIEDEQVFLYRYEEEDGEMDLINIEDDEEFEIASEAFYALFEEDEEYDEEDDEE